MIATASAARRMPASIAAIGSSRHFTHSVRSSLPSPPPGFYNRPNVAPGSTRVPGLVNRGELRVATPHTPPNVPDNQAPNYPDTWSAKQNPRHLAMRGPRFEQMTTELQPQPLSAMEMIQREPIRLTEKRVVECDGGDGALGHPRVFINLDRAGPKACPYCGLRFERAHHHH